MDKNMDKVKVKKVLYDVFIKYHLLFFILIALDQLTKRLALKYLADNTIVIFPWLMLKLQINSGVAFSLLKDAPQWVSALVSVVACGAIEYYLIIKKSSDKIFNILLLVLSAGALGNGIDRWLSVFGDFTGYSGVIDFILPTFFANFNVADIYVTLACIAIVIYIIFSKDEDELSFKEKMEVRRKFKEQLEKERLEAEKAIEEENNASNEEETSTEKGEENE